MTEITSINKETFFKPKEGPNKIKETFIDLYDKIDNLQEQIKILMEKIK